MTISGGWEVHYALAFLPQYSTPRWDWAGSSIMAADEEKSEKKTKESQDTKDEIRIEPFLDMRDPTFRRILQAATSKYNQMLCPIMASVCVRDLCMFWNDKSESCLIVDSLKSYLFHTLCPKCQSTNVLAARSHGAGKERTLRCLNCGNEWGQVH